MKSAIRWISGVGYSESAFLGLLTFGHLVVHWYANLPSLALPFLKTELNLTDIQVGSIVTVQMGVSSGLIIVTGMLADSFRDKGPLIVSGSIVSYGIALFVIGASSSYGLVLVGSSLIGLGSALWHPPAMGALSIKFSNHRATALSIHGMGASVGDAIGPLIVGAIVLVVDWKLTLGLHLFPALLIALILYNRLDIMRDVKRDRVHFKDYLSGIGTMLKSSQTIVVMISNTLFNMGRLSILAFFPIYIMGTLGYSAFGLGVYLALLYALGVVSQPLMGVISDRIGRKMVLFPSFCVTGLLYLAIIIVPAGILLGIIVSLLGMFFYPILNITQTSIMDVAPEGVQSSTMGIMGLFGQPFSLVSPIFAGYLVMEFGINSAFLYASSTTLLAALTLVPVRFIRTN